MSPLVPFAPSAPETIITDDFSTGVGGFTATGDAILVDQWSGADNIAIDAEFLAFWGNDPEAEQSPAARSTQLTKTYTGLPPNQLIRFSVDVAFTRRTLGAVGKFVGIITNTGRYEPNTDASNGLNPNLGSIDGMGRVDASGNFTFAFAVEGLTVSCNLLIAFDNFTAVTASAEFADIIIDSAVLIVNGMQLTISRGGWSFDPGEEWEDFSFPGRTMNVKGCRELVRLKPVIKGSAMMAGEVQISAYRPDGTWTDGSLAGSRVFTPNALRSYLGEYLSNVFIVWKRLRGDYIAVEFPSAACSSYSLGAQDNDEGLFPLTIEAVQDLSLGGTTKTTVPYRIHTLPGDTQVEDLPAGSDS